MEWADTISMSLSPVSELLPLSDGILAGTSIGEPNDRSESLVLQLRTPAVP